MEKVFRMSFAKIYLLYIIKVEKKGQTKKELDEIICWLTGYNEESLQEQLNNENDLESFFKNAPKINPKALLIKGSICGYKVEEIENVTMRHIRYLDKLVDELAKGKDLEKILRKEN